MSKNTLSIVIPTLNNELHLGKFFHYLKSQDYPQEYIEILIMDGGSIDRTIEIAEQNEANVINNPDVLAEPGVNLGIRCSKNKIIMILAVDNYLNDSQFLSKIMAVFDNEYVFAAFPKHESDKYDSIFTKYFNTFTDPFNHFVYGNAANARTFKKIYRVVESNEKFEIYDFQEGNMAPMIALAQGFTFRAGYERKAVDAYDDCAPIIEMIKTGRVIAYVHSASVFHHTINNYSHFLRKQRWATLNALKKSEYGIGHRIDSLSVVQRMRIRVWPIYSVSIVLPLIRGIWGVMRDKELIWLFHPAICFLSFYASSTAIMLKFFDKKNSVNYLRQK